MPSNNDDLLESYDDENTEYDFFQEAQESTNNIAYNVVIFGFLIILGIKFILSLTDTSPNANAIVLRQVQLLKVIEQAPTEQEAQAAIAEYDSLANVLNTLDEE